MPNKDLIKNLLIWPFIGLLVVTIAKLSGRLTWDEMFKILPILGITAILFTATTVYFFNLLRENDELRLNHLKDMNILKSLLRGYPIPSTRTGHENLGDPHESALIMGAIPKTNPEERIMKFLNLMFKGVRYRFIYLDEPRTKAGLIAYCTSLNNIESEETKDKISKIDLDEQLQMKLVPIDTVQLSFDIFDHSTSSSRMLIHFPNFGPFKVERFNVAWHIADDEATSHFAGIFYAIWDKAGDSIDIARTGRENKIVFKNTAQTP